jgi:hypothetical protein
MTKYTIIYFSWWMDKGNFIEETHEAVNLKLAEQYAAAKCYEKQRTFDHWAYHIVKNDK